MSLISFVISFLVGVLFNPMNMLAYQFDHLYLSLTLIYGGLLMATNMIWSHQLIHYFEHGPDGTSLFLLIVGILGSLVVVWLLRSQFQVNDEQWLRRMISHHSTALTTSEKIRARSKNRHVVNLADEIIRVQNQEIDVMKKIITGL